MTTLAVFLSGAILAILLVRALYVLRSETGSPRGTLPGSGHTTLRAEYFSGGGGGGEATEYHVPKDPQDYARLFVPKSKD